ncbi:MAG: hypothetical protein M1817_000815 [Caeruleum heppii]|nr:MAG: hypothetical protein M1817_000815 [Caeruleum heppii]
MPTMMSILSALASPGNYHLLAYGSLLGMELYQSFVMTKICYLALPMPQFTTLQKRVFPVYFRMQVLLIALVAVTHPPGSLISLVRRWYDAVPLAFTMGMAVLNLITFGPRTQQAMIDRIHQETRDGRKYNEVEGRTEEMKVVNKRFSHNHAMSIHLNLMAIGGTIWYGFSLASRLQFAS